MTTEDVIRRAYADLISEVFLRIRAGHVADQNQLHDLADALHNISGILGHYGVWIEDAEYRRRYLRPYDQRWGKQGIMLEYFLKQRMEVHSKE